MKDLDLSAVNLVVDDRDPQAIFDAMASKFVELAPDAQLRNGSVETILMEAMATASADAIYALNRMVGLVVEGVINLYEVARSPGTQAVGIVTLTLDGTHTLTVAAGQRLQDSVSGIPLVVTASTTGTSVSTLAIPVVTETAGAEGNAILAGSAVDLLDSIPYVASAEVTTSFSGGTDPESDATYIDRATTVLARVTSSLVMPEHFKAFCLEDVRVGRANSIDLFQPGGVVGSEIGHITVVVYGHGAQLDAAIRTELASAMHEISASMVTIHVIAPTIVTQNVALTVHKMSGYTDLEVQTAVSSAIAAWMNPDKWSWGRDILATEIIEVAGAVAGVDYVDAVGTPSSTVAIGDAELAQVGTITVTVL